VKDNQILNGAERISGASYKQVYELSTFISAERRGDEKDLRSSSCDIERG
jgi:hypothetical protein